MKIDIWMISWERYETLALCLAGLCGYNSGVGEIQVIDDASNDPRIAALLWEYRNRGLIAGMERMPRNSGIGIVRRTIFERFLASDADLLVQVEGDMLLPPGALATLARAWADIQVLGLPSSSCALPRPVKWLCTHNHHWCHKVERRDTVGGYRIAWARSGSEPFWITGRQEVVENLHLMPGSRPDLVLFLREHGAVSLEQPEIQCQHVGAVNSHYYPQFKPELVTYFNADGSMRQPYPDLFTLDFTLPRQSYPALYLDYANVLAARAPVPIPQAPEHVHAEK